MFELFRRKKRRLEPPPLGQVFPPIDVDRIAASLRLERQGGKRGEKNQPASDEVNLDLIEQEIVDHVAEFRHMGVNKFEEHIQMHADRIARADGVSSEIQTATGNAKIDFKTEIKNWKNRLDDDEYYLGPIIIELEHFRQENRIIRTLHEAGGFFWWCVWSGSILLLESALNGVFFSKAHELGLIGGIATALGISVINIGVASLSAWVSRNFNHRRIGRKIIGALAFPGALFLPVFNFFVAHFRNAAEAGKPWDAAASHAIQRLQTDPLGLGSIEAWLLGLLGVLVAAIASWKTYASGDPYPGYGRVWRKNRYAREAYIQSTEDAMSSLSNTRDKAVEELESAISNMEAKCSEAETALNELAVLRNQLVAFLEQCDQKTNLLLTIYRNANRATRTTSSPEHFSSTFRFERYEAEQLPAEQKLLRKETRERLKGDVEQAIKHIFDDCTAAIGSIKPISEIVSSVLVNHEPQLKDGPESKTGNGIGTSAGARLPNEGMEN